MHTVGISISAIPQYVQNLLAKSIKDVPQGASMDIAEWKSIAHKATRSFAWNLKFGDKED